jgi:hypothetical protein
MISMSYSPDLALNNFYLLAVVKEKFKHAAITNDDTLFEELLMILDQFLMNNWKASLRLSRNAFAVWTGK